MIKIHDREVGAGLPAYIVAEIGINHNGDTALARQMIDAAKMSGCDAVKFQYYDIADFMSTRCEFITVGRPGEEYSIRQETLFKECQLDKAKLTWLKKHCDRVGIHMHATPTSAQGIKDLVELETGVLKNGSDFIQNLDLIKEMSETGLPTVLSTGMSTLKEIDAAVDAFSPGAYSIDRIERKERLVLLHCTSAYPCPDEQANIARVKGLHFRHACLTGLSDHTEGLPAAVLSVAYDAVWIEKHFTTDKNLEGPDQWFSADPAEMYTLVNAVRRAEKMKGDSVIGKFTTDEQHNRETWFK